MKKVKKGKNKYIRSNEQRKEWLCRTIERSYVEAYLIREREKVEGEKNERKKVF